jgi:hypothetical protein
MTTKEAILELVSKLPDDVTPEEVIERICTQESIHRAAKQLDAGQGILHDEMKQRAAKWAE